jgi:oligoribonuclease (3'-5' exoribonuclease)
MQYRVALDTETGGINPAQDSLLEVALVVMDDRGNQLAEYAQAVLPSEGGYRVSPKALELNNH